jgi:hypothetical protein
MKILSMRVLLLRESEELSPDAAAARSRSGEPYDSVALPNMRPLFGMRDDQFRAVVLTLADVFLALVQGGLT